MIRIDDSLLEEIGLISLPKPERDQLLRQIYETLEMRVGMRLAERMTDQQLDEFERFIDTNDEAGALKWLETNFPDYKQVVADELEKLKTEIKKDSGKILETMQAQAGTASAIPAQQPAPTAAPVSPDQPLSQPQPVSNAWTPSGPQPQSAVATDVQPGATTQPVQPTAATNPPAAWNPPASTQPVVNNPAFPAADQTASTPPAPSYPPNPPQPGPGPSIPPPPAG